MSSPLVSIGFPVYNGARSVGRALDSILAQDFEDFELIISDNASTDDTERICEAYAKRDRRIRYFRNATNIGVSPNHDRVFELSRGRYFAWAAHDVEHLPGMLSRCISAMLQAPPTVVLIYPGCELIDAAGNRIVGQQPSIASDDPRPCRRLDIVIRNIGYVTQHYGLIVSAALRRTRLNGSYASSDHVLTAELAMLGQIREIPEILLRRNIDPNSGTTAVRHSQKAWAAWLNPKAKRSFMPLRERLVLECVRGAWHLPLKPADKLACTLVVPIAYYGKALRAQTDRWRRRVRRGLGCLTRLLASRNDR
jgi:glycosyltransferase involved in cell wall biosynthesis